MNKSPRRNIDEFEFKPAPTFDDHAYGPVDSRRLGRSLGINLLGTDLKICNFDCPYCELGTTKIKISQIKKHAQFPSLELVEASLRGKILKLPQSKLKIDYITISGNGEPTLYPDFPGAVSLIKRIRDQLLPSSRLTVLTNGSTLGDAQIVKALNHCDERMMKLDAGNDEMLTKVASPLIRTNLSKLIQGARVLKDTILQSMFIQGSVDNTHPDHIDEWIEVVGLIKPKLVHICSIDRPPAISSLSPVPRQRLKEISLLLEKKTKVPSLIFS